MREDLIIFSRVDPQALPRLMAQPEALGVPRVLFSDAQNLESVQDNEKGEGTQVLTFTVSDCQEKIFVYLNSTGLIEAHLPDVLVPPRTQSSCWPSVFNWLVHFSTRGGIVWESVQYVAEEEQVPEGTVDLALLQRVISVGQKELKWMQL